MASMRTGDPLIIYLDHFLPDFYQEYTADECTFPAEIIFDFQEWRKDDNYMKIVKEEENFDLIGNRPFFFQNENFHITFLAKYVSDEKCEKLKKLIPHSEDMLHLCVTKA